MRFLHRRPSSLVAVPLSIVCAASVLASVAPAARAQDAAQDAAAVSAPSVGDVAVTSVRDDQAVLSEGASAGLRPGSIFTISRGGVVRAKLRVTAVTPTTSTATIFDIEGDYLVTVGDAARYFTFQPLPEIVPIPTPTPAEALPPDTTTETTTTNSDGTTSSTQTATQTGETTNTLPGTSAESTLDVRVKSVDGKNVVLDAGIKEGIRTGVNVPVWRNGSVAAILRVQSASTYESNAIITWADESAPALLIGDHIRLERTAPANGENGGEEVIRVGATAIPAVPIPYETGASNAVVPRADRTYEYLTALAVSGLIRSQTPDVFQDDGILRHRTENDITFTRAQIAGFVREAVDNSGETISARDRVALGALARDYARELDILRVDPVKLANLEPKGGFSLGYSGVARVSFGGGSSGNFDLPFSETQGTTRLNSGADLRANIYGNLSKKLSFFSTVDATTRLSTGNKSSNVALRRGYLSYDASTVARGLKVEIGRNEYWWGPGHFGTLMLSDVAGGLNSVHTVLRRGSFKYEGLYSPLGRGPSGGQRSLYGRNFQFELGSQSRIGFSETLLLPKKAFDTISAFASLSPVPIPLSFIQRARGGNTTGNQSNSLYEFYGETSLARGFQLYGEFLVDDISTTRNNLTRNRLGSLLGAHIYSPKDPAKLGLYAEFTTLGGRTYFPLRYEFDQDEDYNYLQGGDSLGYPVTATPNTLDRGGAESFRFSAYWKPTARLRLGAGFEFADINAEQDILQRQQTFRLRAAYDLSRNLTLYSRVLNVSTGRGSSAVGGGSGIGQVQRRFELGLAQSF